MKICRGCSVQKPLTDFYKHPKMSDGHLNHCIECKRSSVEKYRSENLERIRSYDRNRPNYLGRLKLNKEYQKTERGKIAAAKAKKEWSDRNPEKRKAHHALASAVRSGQIEKSACRFCGSENAQAHHEDYLKPLDVVWLCSRHHAILHKEKRLK